MVTDTELQQWIDSYSVYGRCLALRVPVAVPKLPRSRRLRQALEREATTNPNIRRALDAAAATNTEAAQPGVFRRHFTDAELRIY